jgi:lipopolysaccharide heptosyltransferase II
VHQNFNWLPGRPEIAAQVEQKWHPTGANWVALMPGGRWDNKRWPVQYFVELVRLMRQTPGLKFVILGGKDEHSLGQTIAATDSERCLNLAGLTSLVEMIEWIRLSRLMVTNDSGPMHVAAALGRPVVALFGPTNPVSTGPYGQLGNVLQNTTLPCVPCLQKKCYYRDPLACLHSITPLAVFQKARQTLEAHA